MRVEFQFTPKTGDHWKAAMTALLHQRWALSLWVLFFVVLPWGVALAVLGLSTYRGARLDIWNFSMLLVVPVLAMGLFSLVPLWMARGAQRNAPTLQGAHSYEFSEAGIHLSGPEFRSELEWSAITSFFESRYGAMFFGGPNPIIFLPARAFSSVAGREALRKLVETYVAKQAP